MAYAYTDPLHSGLLSSVVLPLPSGSGLQVNVSQHTGIKETMFVIVCTPRNNDDFQYVLRHLLSSLKDIASGIDGVGWFLSLMHLFNGDYIHKAAEILTPRGFTLLACDDPYDVRTWPMYAGVDFSNIPNQVTEAQAAVYYGFFSQFIAKFITPDNRDSYTNRRFKALTNMFQTDVVFPATMLPAQEHLESMLSHIQNNFELTRYTFIQFLEMGRSAAPLIRQAITQSLNLMRYHKMAYMALIDTFLVKPDHPILYWQTLAANVRDYRVATDFLSKKNQAEIPFTRFLYSQEECACLNRNKFSLLTMAAVAVGRLSTPSLLNFRVSIPPNTEAEITRFVDSVQNVMSTVEAPITSATIVGRQVSEQNERILQQTFQQLALRQGEGQPRRAVQVDNQ